MSVTIQELIDAEDLKRFRQPAEHAWTLPPVAYTSPAVFEAEMSAIFSRDWICVARIDQLAREGDYICADLPGQPIVVTRDTGGTLKAFSRICLHRAMPIVDDSGHGTHFTCPYHNWTYELDGRLRSAPMMEGCEAFAAADCRLPPLKLEVWQGFVFVNMDPEAAPLSPRLAGLARHVVDYGLEQLVIADCIAFESPWNWKILVENFMEAYHHIGTHKDTFEPIYPARDSIVEDNGGAPWMMLRMPGKDAVAEGGLPPLPGLPAGRQRELVALTVFPTLLFAANASMVFWYQLEPRSHDFMRLRIRILMPVEVRAALTSSALAELSETVRFIHTQDIAANEGPWRGLQSSMTRQGRLSLYEKAIWQLNQRWADEMGLP